MKYYIGEFWKMANSADSQIREEGKEKWEEAAKKYGAYYDTIRGKLPKYFIKEFDKNCWFHDFAINNVNVSNIGKRLADVEFDISHDDLLYRVSFLRVQKLILNIPSTQHWLSGQLTWGYTEFELNEDGAWVIRILCDIECEIEISFKQIRIKKRS